MDWFDALIDWIKALWTDFIEFMGDLPLKVLDGFLSAVSSLINALSLPDFVTGGVQSLVNDFPPSVLWAMDIINFPEMLAIVGAALAFKIIRRFATLGIW